MKKLLSFLLSIAVMCIFSTSVTFSQENSNHEKKFISICSKDDKKNEDRKDNYFKNAVKIEKNKDYEVKINLNDDKQKLFTKDVSVFVNFEDLDVAQALVTVNIVSNNETLKLYHDSVRLVDENGDDFKLALIKGSVTLKDKKGTRSVSDDIVTSTGLKLENIKDNNIQEISLLLRPVFAKTKIMTNTKVRLDSKDKWSDYVMAKVGDEVEVCIEFSNFNGNRLSDVMMKSVLPKNAKYINNSTILYNSNHENGVKLKSNPEDGVNIGNYGSGSNALLVFKVKIEDINLVHGLNRLRIWGQVGIGERTFQNYSDFLVHGDK